MKTETHIPEKAHDILREYAAGPHYTNNLMIGTANRAEDALREAWVVMAGSGFAAGVTTRLYSPGEIKHADDSNLKYLKDPDAFQCEVLWRKPTVDEKYRDMYREELELLGLDINKLKSEDIRKLHRNRIAQLVGKTPEEIGNGYITRLLDRPEICDLLVQYFNEHQITEFRQYIKWNWAHRLGQHRLHETKNKARHRQPATLDSYLARTFCPDDMPAIMSVAGESETREWPFAANADFIKRLPIDPNAISDDSLIKVGLAPADFKKIYTLQARRRYKMAVGPQFLALLSEAKMTERPHAGKRGWKVKETARVISFTGADGLEKIGIFGTVSDISTQTTVSGEKQKNRHHRLADTELHIFAGRDEAIRSQDHALEKMGQRIAVYSEFFNELGKYSKQGEDKWQFLEKLVARMEPQLIKKTGYHDQLILRYIIGSSEGKPTQSVIEDPSLIGVLRKTLQGAIGDLKQKMTEVNLLKKQI